MLFRATLWLAVYALPALLLLYPLVEYDTGGHLATGRWIVEHRQVPWHDPFSAVPAEETWIAYSWLFGVMLYGIHGLFGLEGILLWRTLMGLAIVAALHRLVARRQPGPLATAALVAAAALGLSRVLVAERPGLFSILFCVWTLEAILCLREGRPNPRLWLLPLVYALWANVHIQFVHGLFLLGLGWIALLLPGLGTEPPVSSAWPAPAWWKMTALSGACAAATLINPYHVHVYEVILTYSRQQATYEIFAELKAMEFRHYADWTLLALFAAACFMMGWRRSLGVFEVLLLAATAYFSFHARHDRWLVILGATVILAGVKIAEPRDGALSWTELAMLAASFAALWVGHAALQPPGSLQKNWETFFPEQAVRVVEERKLAGPIYNAIGWGGYLSWRLPDRPVSIDGRAQLHGDARLVRFYATQQGAPDWRDDANLLAAKTVLIERASPLASLLRQDPRFTLVHEDDGAVIFVRSR